MNVIFRHNHIKLCRHSDCSVYSSIEIKIKLKSEKKEHVKRIKCKNEIKFEERENAKKEVRSKIEININLYIFTRFSSYTS